MGDLPSGTVTFCFTDIEGSTQLFATLGPRFLDVLEKHRSIIREAVRRHGGAEVKTEGDGFFLAFDDPVAAVVATLDLQRTLAAHQWPLGHDVRVRVGLHVGSAEPVEGDYVAFAVHEASRISAAAHGGQTVISDAVASLVRDSLPSAVSLRDLGVHELRDISSVRLYQLCHPELADVFPPLRTVRAPRGYVPTPASSLVGRSDDVRDLLNQLRGARLVTVTGAGGVGKTRLAVEAAHASFGARPHGVWFVDLAPLTDPAWIPDTVLKAMGVVRNPTIDARAQVIAHLGDKTVLLVIDNCEHVIDACSALVAELLTTCPGLSVLATSREPLGIDGEVAWRLRSLDSADGVELFMQRAATVSAGAAPTSASPDAVAQIVERLDGIPLAIELAAARMRVMTAEQIAGRLDDRFRLLAGGSRTALPRQRTLEATVDWSYGLLDEEERSLLRRLSVFVGGFGLDAVERIASTGAIHTLERLTDKSLIVTALVKDGLRYRLLETIRHYAWVKLVDASEMERARDDHVAYIVELVDSLADGLRDERESDVAETLAMEHDNVLTALEWSTASDDREAALRLVSQMWMYWVAAGRMSEGAQWLDRVLADAGGLDVERAAQAHAGAALIGSLTYQPHEWIERHALRAVEVARTRREPDVRWYDALAMVRLALARDADRIDRELIEEAVRVARDADDPYTIVDTLRAYADSVASQRDGLEAWFAACEDLRDAGRRCGASSAFAFALDGMSVAASEMGRLDDAVVYSQEAVAAARRGPHVWFECFALQGLGQNKGFRGDPDAAVPLREVLAITRESGLDQTRAYTEAELGWIELANGGCDTARGHFESSAQLLISQPASQPDLVYQWGLCRLGIAECAQASGALDEARSVLDELVGLARATTTLGWVIALAENALAAVDLDAGDLDAAARRYRDTALLVLIDTQHAVRNMQSLATSIRGLAAITLRHGLTEEATVLSGAASCAFEPHARSGRVSVRRNRDVVEAARAALGQDRFEASWALGRARGLYEVAQSSFDRLTGGP